MPANHTKKHFYSGETVHVVLPADEMINRSSSAHAVGVGGAALQRIKMAALFAHAILTSHMIMRAIAG